MGNITPRERVKISLSRKEPDRVPLDLGEGRQTSIYPEPYRKISRILGLTDVNIVYSPRATIDSFDERILTAFGIDFRRISLRNLPVPGEDSKDIKHDIWGIGWKRSEDFWSPFYAPLKEATIDDLDKYDWPDPNDQRYFFGLREEAEYKFQNTNYALVANQPNLAYGVMTTAYFMRGLDQFFMDLAINKEFASLLMDKVLGYHLKLYEKYLNEVGEYIEIIQTGDDLGMQTGPFFSLDMYREMIKPKEKTLMDLIKNRTEAKVFYHCDGSVFLFIEDLLELGIDILNPVQPLAKDMEPHKLKAAFGKRLSFHGGIDQQQVLSMGTVEEVREEVKLRIKELAPGGGYILSPAHNIVPEAPAENIIELFTTGKGYGRYPISI